MGGDAGVFSPRVLAGLIAVNLIAFAAAMGFAILPDRHQAALARSNALSHGALGYRALAELLDALEIPRIRQHDDRRPAWSAKPLLVLAEPVPGLLDRIALADHTATAQRTLLVLPKRRGANLSPDTDWVAGATLLSRAVVEDVLALIVEQGEVVRTEADPVWRTGIFVAPTFAGTRQLIRQTAAKLDGSKAKLHPLIETEAGILFAAVTLGNALRESTVYVLSDPDIFANHNIREGHNALLAVQILAWLRPDGAAVLFDQTVSGYVPKPSLWRSLFEFPYAVATLMVFATVAVLLWATLGRFGAPQALPPAMVRGKAALLDNTAELLLFGGHVGQVLRDYLAIAHQDAARRLNAPKHVPARAVGAWLDAASARHRLDDTSASLQRDLGGLSDGQRHNAARLALARRIHAWRNAIGGRHRHGGRPQAAPAPTD